MKNVDLKEFNDLRAYLKRALLPWKKDSLKAAKKKCCISGRVNNLEVHHLHKNFNQIYQELFSQTNLKQSKYTSDYSAQELSILSATFLSLHYKYGLGSIITGELHDTFHRTYGDITTSEQFKEFKKKIKSKYRKTA